MTYFPYIFRGPDHLIAYTKSDVFKRLAKGYEDKTGNHIAAVSYYGTRHTTSNKPIAKCADMQGLKIRVPDVPAYLAMIAYGVCLLVLVFWFKKGCAPLINRFWNAIGGVK